MPIARRLVLMRHAKAEASGPSDAERDLTGRGRTDAHEAGVWLGATGGPPDRALVSAAARTRQTWAALAEGAGWEAEATFDEGLYAAGPETALDLLRALPSDCGSVLLLGHNPTISQLAALLDDGEGDPAATIALVTGFPPCGLAVLAHDGAWSDLDQASARLLDVHVGGR